MGKYYRWRMGHLKMKKILLLLFLVIPSICFAKSYSDVDFVIYNPFTGQPDATLKSGGLNFAKEYAVRIGSAAMYGIDYVCDGANDEVQFMQASVKAGVGGTVWVDPTMTYKFGGQCYIGLTNQTWITHGATLQFASGLASTEYNWFNVISTATDFTVDGFIFDGTGAGASLWSLYIQSIRWVVKNCTFMNIFATVNAIAFKPDSGASYGLMANCTFKNVDCSYIILNYANYNIYSNVIVDATSGGTYDIRGTGNKMIGCTVFGAQGLSTSGTDTTFDNIISYGQTEVSMYLGTRTRVSNSLFSTLSKEAIVSYSNGCVIEGNTFNTIGGAGDNNDCIYIGGNDNIISNNIFTGGVDRYIVNIAAGALRTALSGNNFSAVTGQTADILDNGSDSQAIGNTPLKDNFECLIDSQTVGGYPNFVPIHTGTKVTTKASFDVWESTGITDNTQWKKVSP
jgi:hypothetical protein